MSKNNSENAAVARLSSEGQKEAFQVLQQTSDATSSVDSESIEQIGSTTSAYLALSKEAITKADSEQERSKIMSDAKEVWNRGREEITNTNQRSHESQRGFATLGVKSALVLAGAISGGVWYLSRKILIGNRLCAD